MPQEAMCSQAGSSAAIEASELPLAHAAASALLSRHPSSPTSKPPSPTGSNALPSSKHLPADCPATNDPAQLPAPRPKRPRANVKYSPVRSVKGSARRLAANLPSTTAAANRADGTSPSGEFCSACGAAGLYVCCDGCPRVFHPFCLEPPLLGAEDAGEQWFCRECEAARGKLSPVPSSSGGLFSELVLRQRNENPRAFQLPEALRNRYENVATNPSTGEFVDPSKAKTRKKLESTKGYVEEPDPFRIKTKDGKTILCYSCGMGASASKKLQILGCDACDQYFHLDCLDPPLVTPPPATIKWVCPLHSEQAAPSRRVPKDSVVISVHQLDTPNNGDIEIIPAPLRRIRARKVEEISINRVRYQVPENIIILDFWAKLGKRKNARLITSGTPGSSPLSPLSSAAESHRLPILGRDILPPSSPSSEESVSLHNNSFQNISENSSSNEVEPPSVNDVPLAPPKTLSSPAAEAAPGKFKFRPDLSLLLEAARESHISSSESFSRNSSNTTLPCPVIPPQPQPALSSSDAVVNLKARGLKRSRLAPGSESLTRTRGSPRLAAGPSSLQSKPECTSAGKASLLSGVSSSMAVIKSQESQSPSLKYPPESSQVADPPPKPPLHVAKRTTSAGPPATSSAPPGSAPNTTALNPPVTQPPLTRKRLRKAPEANAIEPAPVPDSVPGDEGSTHWRINNNDHKVLSLHKPNWNTPEAHSVPSCDAWSTSATPRLQPSEPVGSHTVQFGCTKPSAADETDVEEQANKPATRIRIKGTKYLSSTTSQPGAVIEDSSLNANSAPQSVQMCAPQSHPYHHGGSGAAPAVASTLPAGTVHQPVHTTKPGTRKLSGVADDSPRQSSIHSADSQFVRSGTDLTQSAQTFIPAPSLLAPQPSKSGNSPLATRDNLKPQVLKRKSKLMPSKATNVELCIKSALPNPADGNHQVSALEIPSRPKKKVRRNSRGVFSKLDSSANITGKYEQTSPSPVEMMSACAIPSSLPSQQGAPHPARSKPASNSHQFTSRPQTDDHTRPVVGVSRKSGSSRRTLRTDETLQEGGSVSSKPQHHEALQAALAPPQFLPRREGATTQQRTQLPSDLTPKELVSSGCIPLETANAASSQKLRLSGLTSPSGSTGTLGSQTQRSPSRKPSTASGSVSESKAKGSKSRRSTICDSASTTTPTAHVSPPSGNLSGPTTETGPASVVLTPPSTHSLFHSDAPKASPIETLAPGHSKSQPPAGQLSQKSLPKRTKVEKKQSDTRLEAKSSAGNSSQAATQDVASGKLLPQASSTKTSAVPYPTATSFVPHPQNPLTLIPQPQHPVPFVAHPQNSKGFVPHPQHGVKLMTSGLQLPFVPHPQHPLSSFKTVLSIASAQGSGFADSKSLLHPQYGRQEITSKELTPQSVPVTISDEVRPQNGKEVQPTTSQAVRGSNIDKTLAPVQQKIQPIHVTATQQP